MRVALLTSNTALAKDTCPPLEHAGHIVHLYADVQHLLRDLGRESFDLLLVDGGNFTLSFPRYLPRLAGIAGFDAALMLINCRNNERLLADAFAMGADDFIRQGASPREIMVRVDAVLRRHHPAIYRMDSQLHLSPYSFDLDARTVRLREELITLTDREFDLAVFMFRNIGRLFSRGHLLETIWHSQGLINTRTVDTHVSRIRKHLAIKEENGFRLVSSYGTGYRLERMQDIWVSPLLTVSLFPGTRNPSSLGMSQVTTAP